MSKTVIAIWNDDPIKLYPRTIDLEANETPWDGFKRDLEWDSVDPAYWDDKEPWELDYHYCVIRPDKVESIRSLEENIPVTDTNSELEGVWEILVPAFKGAAGTGTCFLFSSDSKIGTTQLSIEDLFSVSNLIRAQGPPGSMHYRFVEEGQEKWLEPVSGHIGVPGKIDEKKRRTGSRIAISNAIRARRDKMNRVYDAVAKTKQLQGMSADVDEIAKAIIAGLWAEIKLFEAIKERI